MKKKPSAILISDIHLREDTPVCRKDDYWHAQWKKMDFISDLQKQYDCPVLCGGDLYDFWKPSPMLISETIKHLPKRFFSIAGQHDLPQHNLDLIYKSGIYTLAQAGVVTILPECSWGQVPENGSSTLYPDVLVWHVTTYQEKEVWMGTENKSATRLLKKYPQFSLILCGDNHKPFVEEYQGRLLVNPGSIMRMDADQIDHKPRVYLWYAETNTVEPVYLPIEQGVISREHIEIKEKRNERIDAFVSQLNGDWAAGLSFEDNLKEFETNNETDPEVMEIVYQSIEPIKK